MTAFATMPARETSAVVRRAVAAVGLLPILALAAAAPANAQRIENQVAVFAALDKVTARISKLEVKLGETVKFGALKLTPRNCFSRPATEQPKTTTFVEVNEIELDGSEKPLFKGWMFAESPGLNAVEHRSMTSGSPNAGNRRQPSRPRSPVAPARAPPPAAQRQIRASRRRSNRRPNRSPPPAILTTLPRPAAARRVEPTRRPVPHHLAVRAGACACTGIAVASPICLRRGRGATVFAQPYAIIVMNVDAMKK